MLYQVTTNLSLNFISKKKVRSDYVQNSPVSIEDEIDERSDIESQVINESVLLSYL
ncbi:hypothetical protein [Marinicellulosiphila megalodicopiae]|uniref:hypothetical protein n=1 Tax=Marinicellulosiphila megalodicopiae TaxID=2724896 RepID=UPI003BB0685F